jgi:Zn-dependent metalloprotease
MAGFTRYHFHATDREMKSMGPSAVALAMAPAGIEPAAAPFAIGAEAPKLTFHNDEAAARHYLDALWSGQEEAPALLAATAPESPAVMPDLNVSAIRPSAVAENLVVQFEQSANNIPIMGGKATVELTRDRELVSVDAHVADMPSVDPIATVSPADARDKIAAFCGVESTTLANLPGPALMYFHDHDDVWHLVYQFEHVPAAPKELRDSASNERGHGLGASPRMSLVDMTYLVDAHDGEIVLYYSATPWLGLDPASKCKGLDETSAPVDFDGFVNAGGQFEMRDPIRKLRTFDLAFSDILSPAVPGTLVVNASNDFAGANTAAVSAHVNATRVFDFYNDVLKRNGVDDNRLEIVSIVNCTYQRPPGGPNVWRNAVWYNKRMLYGQVVDGGGAVRSLSRYLDVIAHELTHGVTETTAGLKYIFESGALNESFSDIFGVIIANHQTLAAQKLDPNDLSLWKWEIGAGLAAGGGPLRDFQDPTRTGDPDHKSKYVTKSANDDAGGVHTNSNIHNKAAYNVLTATDAAGKRAFTVTEVAQLYYYALTRLSVFATFVDTRTTLKSIAKTIWAGDPALAQEKCDAIDAAYDAVGIV